VSVTWPKGYALKSFDVIDSTNEEAKRLGAAGLSGPIWISAAHEYATGRNDDPVNAFSGWYCLAYHNKVLADRLGAIA